MTDYIESHFDINDQSFIATYDELPLWSAPFGLLLLDKVPLRPGIKVLDVGCGTGFPLLELAQRLGDSSTVYGIDPWSAALDRVKIKAQNYGIKNIQLFEGDAAATNFDEAYFDLIVSNLGINNFEAPDRVLRECHRILKPGGHLVLTSNFKGHMEEFYVILQKTLQESGLARQIPLLQEHSEHRSDMTTLCSRLEQAGFTITDTATAVFTMRFADGASLLRHYFIRLAFLDAWKRIIPEQSQMAVFQKLEENLNATARQQVELALTIPYGCIEGQKESPTR